MTPTPDLSCPIARSLSVLGERWTFLILREAAFGATRFSQFRETLGVAPDVLSDRLATLVDHGVMKRVPYREPGSRARDAYELTDSGRELGVVLSALGQWGARHVPWPERSAYQWRRTDADRPVHVAFVDDAGQEVSPDAVAAVSARG
jgi:DNA-binding HxlR family transcriptional regulator